MNAYLKQEFRQIVAGNRFLTDVQLEEILMQSDSVEEFLDNISSEKGSNVDDNSDNSVDDIEEPEQKKRKWPITRVNGRTQNPLL
ncbi:hypothetical protein FQA39_LY13676 [Lamprigera yunnana]|nr:hypothetical protein FQA39_LY13676 [Lamprigera yunnana]